MQLCQKHMPKHKCFYMPLHIGIQNSLHLLYVALQQYIVFSIFTTSFLLTIENYMEEDYKFVELIDRYEINPLLSHGLTGQ